MSLHETKKLSLGRIVSCSSSPPLVIVRSKCDGQTGSLIPSADARSEARPSPREV